MTTQVPSAAPVAKSSAVSEFVRSALEAAEPDALAIVTVPAPLAPLETLVDAAPDQEAVVWEPFEGPAFAAIGSASVLSGSGEGRTGRIRDAARALFANVQAYSFGDTRPPPPRCFGGFSFRPGGAAEEPWAGFGDARFVLPRFRYARDGEHAFLSVAVGAGEASSEAARRQIAATIASTMESLLAALRPAASDGVAPRSRRRNPRRVTERVEATEGEWAALVKAIVSRIGVGEFQKVVIARRMTLSFDGDIDAMDVLSELSGPSNHCARFAFRVGGVTFLGATPERLVRRTGLSIDTTALAGSNRTGEPRAREMLESPKERQEHEFVVREIVRSLSPLCAELDHPVSPEVTVLRHLIHLATPIRGKLARPVHVLDLVERLHPTPAVGGVPTEGAVRFITEHEVAERGWYASPIGWFDAEGDGEFAVGLRSGAFVGNRAYLYAGGGIVLGSDPASEYAETRLKLATLCSALHVAE